MVFVHNDWKTSRPKSSFPWRKVKVKAIDSVKSIHVLGDLDDDLRTGLAFAQVRFPAWETCGNLDMNILGMMDSLAKKYMVRFEA